MPSSFEAMHDETRQLRMLDEPAATPCPRRTVWVTALLLAAPVVVVLLLL